MDNASGVGVLDKAVSVLAAVESGPATLRWFVTPRNSTNISGASVA